MRHTILRVSLRLAALSLLAGCTSIVPGWETPGSTWFRRDAPVVATPAPAVAAPSQTREEQCAAHAWVMAAQFPQDRQLAYSQAFRACMQPTAAVRP